MTLTKYRPNGTSQLGWDWEKMLDNFLGDSLWGFEGKYPAVDVKEEAEQYVLEAELPGFTDKDIDVRIEENMLTIASKKAEEKQEEKEQYLIRERTKCSFTRSFVLPKNADKEKVEAHFKDGILRLVIKKSPGARPRQIEVKVN
jgi:HSP20 family molecular chaperone IbpA